MTYFTPIPTPTPECAAFEPLLPLLATGALTPDETTATREHVAGCAWCRAQRESYDTFETALRRHYGSEALVGPSSAITLEGIMRADEDVNYAGEEDDTSQFILEVTSTAPASSRMFPKLRRPKRFAEFAAMVVVGLLAATLLLTRPGPLNGLRFNQQPLKTAAGAVVFTHSVSWGKLQLNGQTISVTSDGKKPLYLLRGENTLTYIAPPLPKLTCTISAPAAHGDTCPIATTLDGNYMIGPDGQSNPPFGGRVVDLGAVPDHLSEAQRSAFLAAAQRALDAYSLTMRIQPGDHYSTPKGKILTAAQAFPMTLSFQIDVVGIGAGLDGCAPYCETPETNWSITPTIHLDYVDQYGKPQTVQEGSSLGETTMDVRVEWNGAWHISLSQDIPSSTLCTVSINSLPSSPYINLESGLGSSCGAEPWTHEGGVLVNVYFSKTNASHLDDTAQALYRAGALIALDSNAHYLFPSLPMASAHELAIARGLGFKG